MECELDRVARHDIGFATIEPLRNKFLKAIYCTRYIFIFCTIRYQLLQITYRDKYFPRLKLLSLHKFQLWAVSDRVLIW
jgi:hypothetical protein